MSSSETQIQLPDPEQKALAAQWPSVNALAAPLVRALKADAQSLRLAIQRLPNGCTVIDAGIAARGGIEAGRRIAEICMGGLGEVAITAGSPFPRWSWQIAVTSRDPVLACPGASTPAGACLTARQGRFPGAGLGAGRAVLAARSCSPSWPIRTARRKSAWCWKPTRSRRLSLRTRSRAIAR